MRKWQPCNSIALALESLSPQEEMTEDLRSICPIDGTIRAETTKDIIHNILTCKAAKLKVRQANRCAAQNVLARLDDSEITRFTLYKDVRQILPARSKAQLSVKRVELGARARQPTADKSYAQICATF